VVELKVRFLFCQKEIFFFFKTMTSVLKTLQKRAERREITNIYDFDDFKST
jgi:hypothetical protein